MVTRALGTSKGLRSGPSLSPAILADQDPSSPVQRPPEASHRRSHAERMRQAKADLIGVSERTYVQAIDHWLDGFPWGGARWVYRTGPGMTVRLVEEGDTLTQDGIPIVSRKPARLCGFPAGSRTSRRLEAHALAAVAVRGDAGFYDGQPRKLRAETSLQDGREPPPAT